MWSHLRLTVLRATYQAEQPCRLPAQKGATFRGALGYALKELACAGGPEPCRGCLRRDLCAYGALYEPPDPAGDAAAFDRPMPYVLTPPEDRREGFAPGDRIELVLTLVGSGRAWLPWVVAALERMGRSGLGWGRRPWTLVRLDAEGPPGAWSDLGFTPFPRLEPRPCGATELDGAALVAAWPPRREIALSFLSPTHLSQHGRQAHSVDGPLVVRRLLRRLGGLVETYCGGSARGFDFAALVSSAERIRCRAHRLSMRTWERYSTDTQQRHPLSGFVGRVELEDVSPDLWPYLVLGQWVHVGKGASFGMGKYTLDEAPTASPATKADRGHPSRRLPPPVAPLRRRIGPSPRPADDCPVLGAKPR
jgi:hypothetical protein